MGLDYDVLIIGAGPAGSAAALGFLQQNPSLKVALADKATFPRDKACGDGLGPGVIAILDNLGIDSSAIPNSNPISRAEVHGLDGLSFEAELGSATASLSHGLVSKRLDFDNFLCQAAQDKGADLLSATRFQGYTATSDKITTQLHDLTADTEVLISSRLLVGADGANSRVRRIAGINPPSDKDTAIAIRAYASIPPANDNKLIISYGEQLRPGYGWCFPLPGGQANVGCGLTVHDYQRTKPDLKALLDEYLDFLGRHGLTCSEPSDHRTYTLPCQVNHKLVADRVALIGDAGSMVNPLSGEGIVYGMQAAAMLSSHTAQELSSNSNSGSGIKVALAAYEAQFKQEFRAHFRSCQIANRLLRSKLWTRLILGAASVDDNLKSTGIDLMFGKGTMTPAVVARALWHGKRFLRGRPASRQHAN